MLIATRLGPYEVLAKLGEGGMGQVYRATDTTLGRQVAIKILPDAFAGDAERLARFEREVKTLASLNHPHIAKTAPYFHDNSAKTLEEVAAFYANMFANAPELPLQLTAQDEIDMVAYLKLLR